MSRESSIFQALQSPRANTIQFRLTPTHVSYANTLVRLMMTGVEVVGFRADIGDDGLTTDVKVEANTTPMTNEMFAHRIGLLPIHVEEPLNWNKDDFEFVLDITNDSDDFLDVTASDIQVYQVKGEDKIQIPSRTFFRPDPVTGDTCLLATLKPKHTTGKAEELRFKAKASVGIGRENARFIPTSQCSYVYTLDKDEARVKQFLENWLQTFKKIAVSQWETMDAAAKDALVREFNTLGAKRCYLVNERGEPYSFDFTVESAGVLNPLYIVKRACEAGAALCDRFGDQGDETLPDDVLVQPTQKRLLGFDFIFQRQDHTLGNLLQTWLDQNLVENGEVTFAGYNIPHPLRDEMVITIGVADGQEATARRVLKEAARACAQMFRSWASQWGEVSGLQARTVTATAATSSPAKKRIVRRPVVEESVVA